MGGTAPDTIDKTKKVNVKWTAGANLGDVANADDSNWDSTKSERKTVEVPKVFALADTYKLEVALTKSWSE